MAGKSSQSNNRGTDLFGYFVSGKIKEYHTNQFAAYQRPTLEATGGDVVNTYNDGSATYKYHIFESSGSFVVSKLAGLGTNNDLNVLVVAGGGGGGTGAIEGGGGGGGLLNGTTKINAAGTYPIVIGGGGSVETQGGSTTVFGVSATGGGLGSGSGGAGGR